MRTEATQPISLSRILDSLHGRFVASVLASGLAAVLTLAVNVLLGRMLGVAEYGRYMAILSAALLLGSLAVRGADQLLTRELAAGAWNNYAWRSGLRDWAIVRVSLGIGLAVLVYWGWLVVTERQSSGGIEWSILLSGVLIVGFTPLCSLMAGTLNGYTASLRSQALNGVVRSGILLTALGVTWWTYGRIHDAQVALWLQAGGYIVTFFVGWFWVRVVRSSLSLTVMDVSIPNVPSKKGWALASHHFMLVSAAGLIVNRLDVILVSVLAGNVTAGIYVAGARLAQLALMVALAVNIVLNPRISSAWAQNDHAAIRRLMRGGLMFTIPIAVIEVLAVALFGRDIVALFGPNYAQSAMPLFWVTLAYALWTVAAPGYAFLAMTGSEREVASLSWLVVIINIFAILILVPSRGAIGAGWSMATSYAAVLPVLLFFIYKKVHIAR